MRRSAVVEELIEVIGYAATIELLRAWGGRRVHVPKSVDEHHPLALTIGIVAAERLASHMGGTDPDIPAERNVIIEVRNSAILRDLEARVPVKRCADRYGVSPRMIRKIREQQGVRAVK